MEVLPVRLCKNEKIERTDASSLGVAGERLRAAGALSSTLLVPRFTAIKCRSQSAVSAAVSATFARIKRSVSAVAAAGAVAIRLLLRLLLLPLVHQLVRVVKRVKNGFVRRRQKQNWQNSGASAYRHCGQDTRGRESQTGER